MFAAKTGALTSYIWLFSLAFFRASPRRKRPRPKLSMPVYARAPRGVARGRVRIAKGLSFYFHTTGHSATKIISLTANVFTNVWVAVTIVAR